MFFLSTPMRYGAGKLPVRLVNAALHVELRDMDVVYWDITVQFTLFKAKKMNLTIPNYVWLFYDWYPKGWWIQASEDDAGCTDGDIKEFLDRTISIRRYPLVVDVMSITDAGIVSKHSMRASGRNNYCVKYLLQGKLANGIISNENYLLDFDLLT